MPKFLVRLVAFFLVLCLLSDSVSAFMRSPFYSSPLSTTVQGPFNNQALAPLQVEAFHQVFNKLSARLAQMCPRWQPAAGWLEYEAVKREAGTFQWGTLFSKNENESSGPIFHWETIRHVEELKVEPVWGVNLTMENLPQLLTLFQGLNEPVALDRFFVIALLNGFAHTHPNVSREFLESIRNLYLSTKGGGTREIASYVEEIIMKAGKSPASSQRLSDYVDLIHYLGPIVNEAQYFGYSHEESYRFDFSHTLGWPRFLFNRIGNWKRKRKQDSRVALAEQLIYQQSLGIYVMQRMGPFWTAYRAGDLNQAAVQLLSLRLRFPHYYEMLGDQVELLAHKGDLRAKELVDRVLHLPIPSLPPMFEGPLEMIHLDSIVSKIPDVGVSPAKLIPIEPDTIRDAPAFEGFERLRAANSGKNFHGLEVDVFSADHKTSQKISIQKLADYIYDHHMDFDGIRWSLRPLPAAEPTGIIQNHVINEAVRRAA